MKMQKPYYDRDDYSVIIKSRGSEPPAWKWEIYRAGNTNAIKRSPATFASMKSARHAGSEALKKLLAQLFS
jgi:hypothetical protein